MSDIHSRLVEARKAAGFTSAQEAATAMGIPYPTYAGHENGSSGIRVPVAERYAKRFRVSVEWLVTGRGARDLANSTEIAIMGYVGAGAEVEPDFEQVPPEGMDQVTLPFTLNDDLIAFKVRGPSMLPFYKDGAVIVVFKEQKRPIEAFYGEEVAVRLEDGRRFIKTLMRGNSGVTLTSFNAEPIENVRPVWIGEIFATLPPSAFRKVERQGGVQGSLKLKAI